MSSVSNSIKARPDFIAQLYAPPEQIGNKALRLIGEVVKWPIRAAAMPFFKDTIYQASSEKFKKRLDERRLQESREALYEIGGEEVLLETEDGCLIDSMFFDVSSFKRRIEELGGLFVNSNEENHIKIGSNTLRRLMRKMDVQVSERIVKLPKVKTDQEISHEPNVMILTQGNAGIYDMNRFDIFRFLSKGMSVMVFDIRGTGRSSGTPSEAGTYNDIEAVYQYLKERKQFSNDRIHVWGYCLGSGPATELAYRHPGVNLYIDRAAARVSDVATDNVEKALLGNQQQNESAFSSMSRKILRTIVPSVIDNTAISYNNAEKIAKIRGRVFFLYGKLDSVIPEWSSIYLNQRLNGENSASSEWHTVIDAIDHNQDWSLEAEDLLNDFLESSVRAFPETDMIDLDEFEVEASEDNGFLRGLGHFLRNS